MYALCPSVQSGSEEERSGGSLFGDSEEEGEEGEEESSGSDTETERKEGEEGGEASSEEEVSSWLITSCT